MIQDYCREFIKRDQTIETCGRVLRQDGGCDNEDKHATLIVDNGRLIPMKKKEPR